MSVENVQLKEKWESFYRRYYKNDIGKIAQGERKSLYIDYADVIQFDSDLADDLILHPMETLETAEKALQDFDIAADVNLETANVRVRNFGDKTGIREIRSDDVNQLIAVEGIVRKATDVRPKVLEAAFECQRCGTLTTIEQSGSEFKEPYECNGCERKGPFELLFDQSTFVDAQKIRIQESPEGLRGGQTPQNIDVNIEDDITGEVTPGDRVTAIGVLRAAPEGETTTFEIFMEGINVEIEDQDFEDFEITPEDVEAIREISNSSNLFDKMVNSIAPSIYGYEHMKLAMVLQLFSGVTKRLPDESRIRGDMHMLFVGDPGTAKCVAPDTKVTLADGCEREIDELVDEHLNEPKKVDDGVYDDAGFELPSLDNDGKVTYKDALRVWKRDAPDRMYRIETASGREVEVTPTHPLFVQSGGKIRGERARNLEEGDFVATPRELDTRGHDEIDVRYRRSRANNAVSLNVPDELTPELARLLGYIIAEGYVQKNDDNTTTVYVTNNDDEIIEDVKQMLRGLNLNCSERKPHDGKSAREVICSSSEFVSFLEKLEPTLLEKSAERQVPSVVMRATRVIKKQFLRAYIDAEGTVSRKQRELSVTSTSRELVENVRSLLLSLGITSQIETDADDY
ncbi:MAG: LAGLIDADG family homing endonuclease, partial [Halobacteria archaeon]|nr:LAGLIDADG family homing endonuclease [Halobacteria archaeon]